METNQIAAFLAIVLLIGVAVAYNWAGERRPLHTSMAALHRSPQIGPRSHSALLAAGPRLGRGRYNAGIRADVRTRGRASLVRIDSPDARLDLLIRQRAFERVGVTYPWEW